MELHTVAIAAVAFVLSAVLIYLISVFTMREKTFEEVLEEQRKRQEEEKERQKNEKKAEKEQNKKKYRKGKDKSKEKPSQGSDSEYKEPKMVNLEIDPEIIEPVESLAISSKKKGKKVQKPILLNKEEKPLVAENKQAKEIIHKPLAPKDELELRHEHEHVKDVKSKQQADHQMKASKKQAEVKQVETKHEKVIHEKIEKDKSVHVEKTHEVHVQVLKGKPVSETEKKTAKTKGGAGEKKDEASTGSHLIASVKAAVLKDSEIQTLIDILLNKQGPGAGGSAEWNKKSQKGDPLSLLKKQLEEKERALQEEQALAMSANNKVKEVRQDLSSEKARFSSLEKWYQEKIAMQTKEIQAFEAKMLETHEQHVRESKNLQARLVQFEQSSDRSIVQKLQEEKKILTETLAKASAEKTISPAEINSLRQKVQIMEKELASNAIKLNSSENSKKILEQKIAKYEEQLKKYDSGQKDTEALMSKKMDEVNQELRKSQARNESVTTEKKKAMEDLQKANNALKTAQKEVSTLKTKLQELEKHLSNADVSKELEAKLQESERQKSDLEGNVRNLEKQLSDSVQSRAELQNDMDIIRQENYALVEEMKTTKERQAGEGQEAPSTPAGAPNGDIHDEGNGNKTKIDLAEHEKILGQKLQEISVLQGDLQTKKSEMSSLQEQLESQKKKNNELREKNWKAMEALEKTEKSVTEKVDSAVKTSREKAAADQHESEALDKGVLQRLFPEVNLADKLVHKEWMTKFEKEASVYLTKLSSNSSNNDEMTSKLKQLEETNQSLQSEVAQYKSIVHESENKLHQLEQSVESEEKKWKEKLQQAQTDLGKMSRLERQVQELEESKKKSQSEVQEYRVTLTAMENKVKELGATCSELSQQKESKDSQEILEKCYQLEVRIGELEDSNTDYKKQINNYRSVLSLTEEKLTQLETRAESEEKKWQEKKQLAEKELEESKKVAESLRSEVKSLKGSSEMEVKVQSLEAQLKTSETRCSVLQKEAEETKTKIITLETQINTTKESSLALEDLRKQLEELQRLLEIERKKNKDLSSNVVKLNGIIKTGQDALKQEQDVVSKLRQQIDEKAKANSTTETQQVEQAASPASDTGTSV